MAANKRDEKMVRIFRAILDKIIEEIENGGVAPRRPAGGRCAYTEPYWIMEYPGVSCRLSSLDKGNYVTEAFASFKESDYVMQRIWESGTKEEILALLRSEDAVERLYQELDELNEHMSRHDLAD